MLRVFLAMMRGFLAMLRGFLAMLRGFLAIMKNFLAIPRGVGACLMKTNCLNGHLGSSYCSHMVQNPGLGSNF